MIKIPGTLEVKTIRGGNGDFNVGELQTAIGEFKIKDKILEQFQSGSYPGEFLISKIYPHSYTWYGKITIEIRAMLADVMLDSDDPGDSETATQATEPDPADEERSSPSIATQSEAAALVGGGGPSSSRSERSNCGRRAAHGVKRALRGQRALGSLRR